MQQLPYQVQSEKLESQPPIAEEAPNAVSPPIYSTGGEAGTQPPIEYRRRSWNATPYRVQSEKLERTPYRVQAEKLERNPLSSTGGEAGTQTPYRVQAENLERNPLSSTGGEAGTQPPIKYRRRSWNATPYQVQAEKLERTPLVQEAGTQPPIKYRRWSWNATLYQVQAEKLEGHPLSQYRRRRNPTRMCVDFSFFEHSTLLAIPMHLMFLINFQCFFIIAVKAISRYKFWKWKKNKNTFFIFSGIQIHDRLTKKHEHFRFSRHFPPVSKQFPKSNLYLMPLPSARENRQETQNFHFLQNFGLRIST